MLGQLPVASGRWCASQPVACGLRWNDDNAMPFFSRKRKPTDNPPAASNGPAAAADPPAVPDAAPAPVPDTAPRARKAESRRTREQRDNAALKDIADGIRMVTAELAATVEAQAASATVPEPEAQPVASTDADAVALQVGALAQAPAKTGSPVAAKAWADAGTAATTPLTSKAAVTTATAAPTAATGSAASVESSAAGPDSRTRTRRRAAVEAAREREDMLEAARYSSTRAVLWLRNFLPPPVGTDAKEGLRMALGICIGIMFTALVSRWWGGSSHEVWMIVSLGASSVLVFGMPASPLAQPWPVAMGSVVSVLVGTLCEHWIQDEALALGLAIGLSAAVMVPLRCLHPPAVGLASFVVLSHVDGLQLVWFPVLFNIVMLLACAVAYNMVTGRPYPHPQHSHRRGAVAGGFTDADLDAALNHYNQVLDISRADLEGLLHLAGKAAFQRTLGELRCSDIMSRPVLTTSPEQTLKQAWALMHAEEIKALPVVDGDNQVLGIISNADFIKLAQPDTAEGLGKRLKNLVWRSSRSKEPQTVAELMTRPVQTAARNQLVIELMPLFSADGHHHLPVVDEAQRLVGIITQTDLVRVLAATVGRDA